MSLQQEINAALQPLNDAVLALSGYVWYIGLALLVFVGVVFLFKFRCMQAVRIPEQIGLIRRDIRQRGNGSRMSSFQAFCLGLGQRIGIGNILGVATAILLGGPGSIFWMWVFAFIGAATSFVECTLGQIFKRTRSDGQYYGGPAYYIKNGLKNHKLAVFFATWTVITYGVGFVANVAANASGAFETVIPWDWMPLAMGVVIAVLTAYLVFGGIMRISKAAEHVVPLMALGWLVFTAAAVLMNLNLVDDVLMLIVGDAFDFSKMAAGFAGSCVMWGIKRGIFSNEAGIGSIPSVSSTSDVKHPVHQGYLQSMGVLVDTLVVCTASAFLILIAFPEGLGGLGYSADFPVLIVDDALNLIFGAEWTKYILTVFIFAFGFTSLIGNYTVSESNLRFITDGRRAVFLHKAAAIGISFLACILPISLVWNTVDVLMAVMTITNVLVLYKLMGYVKVAHDDYRRQKDAGVEEPVFTVEVLEKEGLDVSGVVSWDAGRED